MFRRCVVVLVLFLYKTPRCVQKCRQTRNKRANKNIFTIKLYPVGKLIAVENVVVVVFLFSIVVVLVVTYCLNLLS